MWRLNPASSVHYRHWGNDWVVFDVGSGQTHEMDSISAVALMYCENGWIRLPEIAAGVMSDLQLPKATCLSDALLRLLNQFTRQGLLEQMTE